MYVLYDPCLLRPVFILYPTHNPDGLATAPALLWHSIPQGVDEQLGIDLVLRYALQRHQLIALDETGYTGLRWSSPRKLVQVEC